MDRRRKQKGERIKVEAEKLKDKTLVTDYL
jgi:hypothetical protein